MNRSGWAYRGPWFWIALVLVIVTIIIPALSYAIQRLVSGDPDVTVNQTTISMPAH
jgi:hypothetical protein